MGHLHPDVECRIGYCEGREWQEGFRTNPGMQRDTDRKHTGAACREAEGGKKRLDTEWVSQNQVVVPYTA